MTGDTATGDSVSLLCSVRQCALPLARQGRRFVCPKNHSFDIARSGYVNLLQPQDRRSKAPGDTREAVSARRRFLQRGFAGAIVEELANLAAGAPEGPVLDVGCGEGHHLETFRRRRGGEAHGIDISVAAVDLAARSYPECRFVVANADRRLPWADGSFALVTSITARINAPEFRRVLRDGGIAMVALPAPDDLAELREAVLGEGKTIDRTGSAIATIRPELRLLGQKSIRTVARLDREAIEDVMRSSYRGMRVRERERLDALQAMDVTLSRDVLLWVRT